MCLIIKVASCDMVYWYTLSFGRISRYNCLSSRLETSLFETAIEYKTNNSQTKPKGKDREMVKVRKLVFKKYSVVNAFVSVLRKPMKEIKGKQNRQTVKMVEWTKKNHTNYEHR